MRIIKPSKRPGKGQLNRQAHSSTEELNEEIEPQLDSSSNSESSRDRSFEELDQPRSLSSSQQGIVSSAVDSPEDARKKQYLALHSRAIRLLAMREHSTKELHTKLASKADGYLDLVGTVIDEMLNDGYLSDERYTESYTRSRLARGFGPVKIKLELKNKGVDDNLANDHIDAGSGKWLDAAIEQYKKRYAGAPVNSYSEWTKRARFLQSRGFTMDHIHSVVPEVVQD